MQPIHRLGFENHSLITSVAMQVVTNIYLIHTMCYVPGRALYINSDLIFTTTLWYRYCYSSHFTYEGTDIWIGQVVCLRSHGGT